MGCLDDYLFDKDNSLDMRLKPSSDCRRIGKEFIYKQTTYCGLKNTLCIYKYDTADKSGNYRCMLLEKQYNP